MTAKPNRNDSSFSPQRFLGLLVHVPICLLLIFAEFLAIRGFLTAQPGASYLLYSLGACLLLVPLAFFTYRTFSLIFSSYSFNRNSLVLKWGLHKELIPLKQVEWIRTPDEMPYDIPWSFVPMPGAYLGRKETAFYKQIDFFASDTSKMLFVGTPHTIYAVSPARPERFLHQFEQTLQLGVLTDVSWESVQPAEWLFNAWHCRTAHITWPLSLNILTVLLFWISFRFSYHSTIELQFSATGQPQEILPVESVMILPSLAAIFWLIDIGLGIYLFRNEETRHDAELIWCGAVVISLIFLAAGIFLI